MNFKSSQREEMNGIELPDSIYASVIHSLYKDLSSLIVGTACAALAPLVLYWKIADPVQILFSILFILSGVYRTVERTAYRNAINEKELAGQEVSFRRNAYWEMRYLYSASTFIAVLGAWYFVTVLRSDDPFTQLMPMVLCLGHLSGLIGRNFSSSKVINAQGLILGFFLVTGTIIVGDIYHVILALFILPFMFAVRNMAARLRDMLFYAELNALDNSIIANRFDVALDNVSHGVAMFSHEGTIVVANERFKELLGLGDWEIVGHNITILSAARITGSAESSVASEISNCLTSGTSRRFTFQVADKVMIEADYNSMPNGGVIFLSDISDRMASEKAIMELANFDPLTGLPNRRYFLEEVKNRLQDSNGNLKPCSMFFMDLDKFKEVNDTLGHAVGDKLLKMVSTRLHSILDESAMKCRFGGDEFVLVLPRITATQDCAELAKAIISTMSRVFVIDGNQINVGASVGIAIAPLDGNNSALLLQYADAALYEAKAKGRSTHVFYSDALGDTIRLRREMEVDLKQAIDVGELDLHYQPLISLQHGRILTCEALLRWDHPTRGRISPAEFIPVAEESGLIVKLGEYVLRKAMMDCLTWDEKTGVAVNVSSIQFYKSDIVATVDALLKETGLSPERLGIEVTETAMLDNIDDVTKSLNALSEMGVKISLDDFGTGFSNLSYLHALPFDKVKIDKSFIEHGISNDRSLVLLKGVVDLLKRLRLTVVLEGIENEEQLDVLINHVKVDEVQGFLFSRPLPLHDLQTLIAPKYEEATEENTGIYS